MLFAIWFGELSEFDGSKNAVLRSNYLKEFFWRLALSGMQGDLPAPSATPNSGLTPYIIFVSDRTTGRGKTAVVYDIGIAPPLEEWDCLFVARFRYEDTSTCPRPGSMLLQ